jgi:hypothetical protein
VDGGSGLAVSVGSGIVILARGRIGLAERRYVRDRIAAAVADGVPGRPLSVRVKLANLDPSPHPAVAQARLEVGWRLVRAVVSAPTITQAGARLAVRLTAQWRAGMDHRPRPWPDPAEFLRPRPLPIPAAERRLVRRKTYRLARCAPGAAGRRMDALDYRAHLFIDLDTGQDAIVYRAGPTGYRLARQAPAPLLRPADVPLTIDPNPAPVLPVEQAMARLGTTEDDHLFFTDPVTGRGQLLYRRVDGHYGLVSPS